MSLHLYREHQAPVQTWISKELVGGLASADSVAALESLHAASGVHELLLSGIERMALVAEFHVQAGLGGLSGKGVAARANYLRDDVLGVNILFHSLIEYRRM